jgi:hypothetical protein
MLTGHWFNDLMTTALAAVCDVLLKAGGLDTGIPRSNDDLIWY